jgi:hypothetical protein
MKTYTPETDVWEAYCDECYYHMWRLRRKTERGWDDGFHIHTGEEAKGLCETLNKLERERDEARAESIRWMSIAEGRGRTDDDEQLATAESQLASYKARYIKLAGKYAIETHEITAQRDRLAAVLQRIRDGYGGQVASPNCCEDCDYLLPIDEALQSLTQNAEP